MYGSYENPRYSALSYTWGRFTIKSDAYPEITPMPIKGITWDEYLPRINPRIFTNAELSHAIKTAACPWPEYDKVDFIWLDIACIDQTPGSAQNASEVGRQARIFKGAEDTFVWLYSFDCESFLEVMQRLQDTSEMPETDPNRYSQLISIFEEFERDPWFSSLWTLQEAFLCPEAAFILRDGFTEKFLQSIRAEGLKAHYKPCHIKQWAGTWHWLGIERRVEGSAALIDKMRRIGIVDSVLNQCLTAQMNDLEYPKGVMGNPFGLLVGSKHRTSTHEEDRVYAIMQVFDLKLGKSAAEATGKVFTFEDLREQLAVALLEKYPLMSQLMVQDKDCKKHQAWAISTSVTIPREGYEVWDHVALGGLVDVKASMTTEVYAGDLWARFSGPVISLEAWARSVFSQVSFDYHHTSAFFDRRWAAQRRIVAGWQELKDDQRFYIFKGMIPAMVKLFNQPKILFLGHLSKADKATVGIEASDFTLDSAVGLVLKLEEDEPRHTYTRLGVMFWQLGSIYQITQVKFRIFRILRNSCVAVDKVGAGKMVVFSAELSQAHIHESVYTRGRATVGSTGKVVVTWDPLDEGSAGAAL
ncbi:hypothetical protein BDW74DRAFT_136218 [Aspergillus multicolor]|uniref:uncharacterized protein n=1 Tax=Aspergillus multicolor TaxID=41759 RepID=UPI003CCDC555